MQKKSTSKDLTVPSEIIVCHDEGMVHRQQAFGKTLLADQPNNLVRRQMMHPSCECQCYGRFYDVFDNMYCRLAK
jgi:hypothetical protein